MEVDPRFKPFVSHGFVSVTGEESDMWGIKMSALNAPLHMIHLHSPLVSGHVKVAVLPRFPIDLVYFG